MSATFGPETNEFQIAIVDLSVLIRLAPEMQLQQDELLQSAKFKVKMMEPQLQEIHAIFASTVLTEGKNQ
jgi:hypothetical protein